VTAVESGTGIRVETHYPEHSHHTGNFSYSVDLELTVPASASLLIKNRFGSTDVSGIGANSEIISAQGAVTLHDTRGNQRIENSFASVTVDDAEGDVSI